MQVLKHRVQRLLGRLVWIATGMNEPLLLVAVGIAGFYLSMLAIAFAPMLGPMAVPEAAAQYGVSRGIVTDAVDAYFYKKTE